VIVLVCGGRSYEDRDKVFRVLDASGADFIIEGGATGADRLARRWAEARGFHFATVDALWYRYGKLDKSAGAKRNRAMLRLRPDKVIAFPGGNGTHDMVTCAKAAGIPVEEIT
jgi:ABC-type hemin transport system substrate-binding protein